MPSKAIQNKRRSKKIAILFLSHILKEGITEEYKRIYSEMNGTAECHFLFHSGAQKQMPERRMLDEIPNIYPFTNGIHEVLRYPSANHLTWHVTGPREKSKNLPIPGSFFPFNVIFPVIYFFLKNRHYDYYWLVEHDVRFTGKWEYFFSSFQDVDADLITSRIWNYFDKPDWYWWRCMWHSQHFIPLEKRFSSFNPVYRISNRALQHLHRSYGEGWVGHYEVVVPTLLRNHGFKLVGIGGTERFILPGQEKKFSTPKTFRWRPVFKAIGTEADKLYHPIKT